MTPRAAPSLNTSKCLRGELRRTNAQADRRHDASADYVLIVGDASPGAEPDLNSNMCRTQDALKLVAERQMSGTP